MFPELGNWLAIPDGDPRGYSIFKRHYSFYRYKDNRLKTGRTRKFVGPGETMILLSVDRKALFVWRKYISDDGQTGVNCAVFRNEGDLLSSDLIKEAEELAWRRWPGERLFTFVNPEAIKSENPGYCFKVAGWKTAGRTKKRNYIILEKLPE